MARLIVTTPVLDPEHIKCPNCNREFSRVAYYTGIRKLVSIEKLKSGETVSKYSYSEITPHVGGYCRHCHDQNSKALIKYCVLILAVGVILTVFGFLNAFEIITLMEAPTAILPILGGLIVVAIGIVGIVIVNKAPETVWDQKTAELLFIQDLLKDNNTKPGLFYMFPQFVADLKPEEIEKPVNKSASEPIPEQGKSEAVAEVKIEDIPQSTKNVWKELTEMGFTISVEEVYAAVQAKRNEFAARKIAYFGSDFELALGSLVQKELPDPYEEYAKEILNIFSKPLDKNTYQSQLRKIGEKIDHNHKQVLIVKRAEFLCQNAVRSGNRNAGEFSISTMEYAWSGLGGWMP